MPTMTMRFLPSFPLLAAMLTLWACGKNAHPSSTDGHAVGGSGGTGGVGTGGVGTGGVGTGGVGTGGGDTGGAAGTANTGGSGSGTGGSGTGGSGTGGSGGHGVGGGDAGGAAGASGGGGADCGEPTSRSWGAGPTSEVLALLPEAHGLWVAGYEGATNLDGDGDSLGFVEYWSYAGRGVSRYTLDRGTADAITALAAAGAGRVWFAGYSDAWGQGWDVVLGGLDAGAKETSLTTRALEAHQYPTTLAVDGSRLLVAGYDKVFVVGKAVERWEDPIAFWFDIQDPAEPVNTMHQRFATDASDGFEGLAFVAGQPRLGGFRSDGGERGAFLKLLNEEGQQLSEQLLVPAPASGVAGLLTHAGKLYVAGTTSSPLSGTAVGGQDGFFGLLDDQGQFEWVRQFGTASSDMMTAFAKDAEGHFVIAGETLAGEGEGSNIVAFRFDQHGNQLGSFSGGSPHDETVTAIAIDGCDTTLVAGGTLGDLLGSSSAKLARREAYVLAIDWN